ncbi:MAG TPA: alpha-2-macroglobulin family protein, partial [Chitinophagaceae bacterium]
LTADSLRNLSIRVENLAGEYQPATVTLTITPLITENRLVRERYWQQPDQFVLSKEEYVALFPHDEYKGEGDYRTWPKGAVMYSKTDTTAKDKAFRIDKDIAPGYYAVQVTTKDKEGEEVKYERYVEVFDPKEEKLNQPRYLWTRGSERPVEPGGTATIQVGTSAPDVFLIRQVDKPRADHVTSTFDYSKLDNGRKTFEFPITEADRGGYGVTYAFVRHNRVHQFHDIISVPWTNKELKIEHATFRDKTLPGSEEMWKVKISGYKGDKVAAEMLASMYDASLDQFRPHSWSVPGIWSVYARTFIWRGGQNFSAVQSDHQYIPVSYRSFDKRYDRLLFDLYGNGRMIRMRGAMQEAVMNKARRAEGVEVMALEEQMISGAPGAAPKVEMSKFTPPQIVKDEEGRITTVTTDTAVLAPRQPDRAPATDIQVRKNLQETAFFFPDLHTDKDGNIEFSFTTPEALTRWKLQTFAHTKELAMGVVAKELVTQKELMVQPAPPRFLRQGDRMEFTVKIVNLSGKELTGQAELQLLDAATNRSVDGWFMNTFPNQYFTVAAGQSEVVKFPLEVPYQFTSSLVWRVVARSGTYSDGEEAVLPVLSNKLLVTETLPLPVRGAATKAFTFDKLLKAGESETLQHHALTVEYTTNPAWYAVQALPYLMEYPYDCAEQVWNRYYANALATMVTNSSPRIKAMFERWRTTDTAALVSNLQKNEELKSAMLEETPWVLQAKNEEQQKKNIALLFDLVRMGSELKTNLEKLKGMQSSNGGFVWFKGGPDDRYITQYIVTGIGHLRKLKALNKEQEEDLDGILKTALPYLDRKIREDYEQLVKSKVILKDNHTGYTQVQYLYMHSFFPQHTIDAATKTAYNYFYKQAQQFWTRSNKYVQGMTAMALHRTGDKQTPLAILKSLKETAIVHEELGMYWKEISFGKSWFWWHAPIETQALLIEAFSEISKQARVVDDLRTWLLKNKQTTNWRTTKATADACYALLLQGTDWLSAEPEVQVKLGTTTLNSKEEKTEAGTGYFKKTIEGSFVKPEMGNISVTVQSSAAGSEKNGVHTSWGAVYWQYFEEMDKITTAATPLQLNKKLFVEKNTDRGPVLTPVGEGALLAVGDKIKVRIELRVDRDMEYVHMKDLRASALEPVNVLSGYKWQGGLGYYESTRDASTNFFFNYLRKGTYVFEYPLFVTHTGTFSNGITTIQCMYAPEFTAHSEGVKITVE